VGDRCRGPRCASLRADSGSIGYLSRLLRSLRRRVDHRQGQRVRQAVRIARLTSSGGGAQTLDRRSDEVAGALARALGARQRARLVAAMADVELLLRAGMIEIEVADQPNPTADCLRSYFAELDPGSSKGFDPAGATPRRRPAAAARRSAPGRRLGAGPVGCGALHFLASGSARSSACGRRMPRADWGSAVASSASSSAGRRARRRVLRLETNRSLSGHRPVRGRGHRGGRSTTRPMRTTASRRASAASTGLGGLSRRRVVDGTCGGRCPAAPPPCG